MRNAAAAGIYNARNGIARERECLSNLLERAARERVLYGSLDGRTDDGVDGRNGFDLIFFFFYV